MQFTGKITDADLKEVGRMSRTKMYWVKLVAGIWYPIALLLIALWATIAGLLGKINPNFQTLGVLWAVVAAFWGWMFYRTRRARARQLAQVNAQLPDQVSLTNEGLKLDGPNGATTFLPWTKF